MRIEKYKYNVSNIFLSALINNDCTGLDDFEQDDLDTWEEKQIELFESDKYFSHFHWDYKNESNFCKCEITGLQSDCCELTAIVFYAEEIDDKYIGIIEVGESVFHIVKRGNYIIAGTACNVGMLSHYDFKIDSCFSFDENLQAFIEEIEEKEEK